MHTLKTRITSILCTLLSTLLCSHAYAFGNYINGAGANVFLSDNTYYGNSLTPTTQVPYDVTNQDLFLAGDFTGDGVTELAGFSINGYAAAIMKQDPINNKWSAHTISSLSHLFGSSHINNALYAVGDFTGDGKDNVLRAYFDGRYATWEYVPINHPLPDAYLWNDFHKKHDGDIGRDDRLLSGDFDGDGIDETILIKPNTAHFTMNLNLYAAGQWSYWNWDVVSSGQHAIAQWNTSVDDHYVVGDFNGDGKDEIVALYPHGWHQTLSFTNNQWTTIEGDASGIIGGANIGWNDRYAAEDFDGDGKDEIVLINRYHPWSLRLGFSNNAWYPIEHNQGNDYIANWQNKPNDHIVTGDFNGDGTPELLMIDSTNAWQSTGF